MNVGKKRNTNTTRCEQLTVRLQIPELQGKNPEPPDYERTENEEWNADRTGHDGMHTITSQTNKLTIKHLIPSF
jgi:hypothetical protein